MPDMIQIEAAIKFTARRALGERQAHVID